LIGLSSKIIKLGSPPVSPSGVELPKTGVSFYCAFCPSFTLIPEKGVVLPKAEVSFYCEQENHDKCRGKVSVVMLYG